MESFVCLNPETLQDASDFGLKVWLLPLIFLIGGWSAKLIIWKNPKFSRTHLAPRRPWLGAILGTLVFLAMGSLVINDKKVKMQALEAGDFNLYQGQVANINKNYAAGGLNLAVNNIDVYVTGTVTYANGKTVSLKGDEYLQKVSTQNAYVGVAGKTCSGQTCGLKLGDRVRIKTTRHNRYPLLIEKCSRP